jgi:hypothetical protein
MLAINLYYLYLSGRLIVRPRRLIMGGAAGAASRDAARAAAPPMRRWRLCFDKVACEALRLPNWLQLWRRVRLPLRPSLAPSELWLPCAPYASPLRLFLCITLQPV